MMNKLEEAMPMLVELAKVVSQEKLLMEECLEHIRIISTLEVSNQPPFDFRQLYLRFLVWTDLTDRIAGSRMEPDVQYASAEPIKATRTAVAEATVVTQAWTVQIQIPWMKKI